MTPACQASKPSATSAATSRTHRPSAVSTDRNPADSCRSAANCVAPTRPAGDRVTVIVNSGSSSSRSGGVSGAESHSEKPASATGRRSPSTAS